MAETKHTHRYLNYVVKNQQPDNPNYPPWYTEFPLLGLTTFPSAMIGRICSCKDIRWMKWGKRKEMHELAKQWQALLKQKQLDKELTQEYSESRKEGRHDEQNI